MADSDISYTTIVRGGVARATAEFSIHMEPLGFKRTKKMFWTRCQPHRIEFVHLHRSGVSYGAPGSASVAFRVHLGIRVLNDGSDFVALNGPSSDDFRSVAKPYHFRFNANTGSTYERCIEDLVRFVREIGEPWFEKFSSLEKLMKRSDSPFGKESKEYIEAAVRGNSSQEAVLASAKLLGLRIEQVLV